jgi:hypothetical protein
MGCIFIEQLWVLKQHEMKIYLGGLIILLSSCNPVSNKQWSAPADAIIIPLITEKYTEQNKLDGVEFATVDTILIKEKKWSIADSSCLVKFHIICSYQPAPLAPEYQREPFTLNSDTSIEIIYKNAQWVISEGRH